MSSALTPIARAFFEAMSPLAESFRDPLAFQRLLQAMGWNLDYPDDGLSGILDPAGALGNVASSIAALVDEGDVLLERLEGTIDPLDVVDLIEVAKRLIDATVDLGSAVTSVQLDALSLPPELKDPSEWSRIAAALPEHLLLEYLQGEQSSIYAMLLATGLVEENAVEGTRNLNTAGLADLVTQTQTHLPQVFGWGNGFDHTHAVQLLANVLLEIGLPARVVPVRQPFAAQFFGGDAGDAVELEVPFVHGLTPSGDAFVEFGLVLLPVPRAPGGTIDGFVVTNVAFGDASVSYGIRDGWTVEMAGALDQTGAVGVRVDPSGVTDVGTSGSVDATMTISGQPTDSESWRLIGAENGTRIELSRIEVAAGFHSGDVNLTAEVRGIALVVSMGDADGFVGSLLGSQDIRAEFDLDAEWSAVTGFKIGGGATLDLVLPLDLSLGPAWLDKLSLSLSGDDNAQLGAGVTFGAVLGPFSVEIEDVGIAFSIRPDPTSKGTLGVLDIGVGFKPPKGAGFSIDADGVVGGGYLSIDPEAGEYAGALQIDIVGLGLTALGILNTKLEEPGQWALYFNLSLGIPSIPLGFGFSLTGVGGLIGIGRTLDEEALLESVSDGSLDDLMFPPKPITNITRLLAEADAVFPLADGEYVFGPMVQITWGIPSLITGELGILLALPAGEIAVLGSVEALLPVPEAPLLELHMDVAGIIDLAEGTFMIKASIYDSKVIGLELSGDMAMYARVGSAPYFLLSVGGYNPAFKPATVPTSITSLSRMRGQLSLGSIVNIVVESYFAVTSNTLQFGGALLVEASATVLGTTYTAAGWFEIDVLLRFTPFAIIADASAGVTVRAGGRELAGVTLSLHLEGPEPWYAVGQATFKFFGINVNFPVEVGSAQGSELPETVDVLDELVSAMGLVAAWGPGGDTSALQSMVTLAEPAPAEETQAEETDVLWVWPDSTVEVRQNVAPLNRTIDTYGKFVPSGKTQFDIEAVGFGARPSADYTVLTDYFAPADFLKMGKTDKLSGPSFELWDAGVAYGSDETTVPAEVETASVAPGWTSEIYEPPTGRSKLLKHSRRLGSLPLTTGWSATTVAHRTISGQTRYHVDSVTFSVTPTQYAVVRTSNGTAAARQPASKLFSDASRSIQNKTATLRVVPRHAAQEKGADQ